MTAEEERGTDITASLISHTNVGKTSLARTLLRADVGEILDAAHTTLESSAHVLISDDTGNRLLLWDTPGFGDTVKLHRRLSELDSPIGWLLAQVWDRITDRATWSGQQAAKNVRDEADVVLYLVNANEDPRLARYIGAELAILEWIGRPVIVLLNQLPPESEPEERAHMQQMWREACSNPNVHAVVTLDAFARGWVEEAHVLLAIADALRGRQRETMVHLVRHWETARLADFDAALDALAEMIAATATDREPLARRGPSRLTEVPALRRLAARLNARVEHLTLRLITLAGIEGGEAEQLETALNETRRNADRADPMTGATSGALLGAGAGAALDLALAGLSFGVFTALGATFSGAAGLAWSYSAADQRGLSWSPEFLLALTERLSARYLAIAHHGRAAGAYGTAEAEAAWALQVRAHMAAPEGALQKLTRRLQSPPDDAAALYPETRAGLAKLLSDVLTQTYPSAAPLFERSTP